MDRIKVIIVDDEWLVRSELKQMLAEYPDIVVAGEAADVHQANQLIQAVNPDVIFLDVQMPGESGFDLIEKAHIQCKVIFITAYNQYALRAFEVNALDYLLKPIRSDRLSKTIKRILDNDNIVRRSFERVKYDDVIYLRIDDSIKFVKVCLLECIIAEGNYSYIHYNNKRDIVAKTLLEWEKILPSKYFVRIHRSTIVNFDFVVNVKKLKNYTYEVYVNNIEKPFVMSRRYAVKVRELLKW